MLARRLNRKRLVQFYEILPTVYFKFARHSENNFDGTRRDKLSIVTKLKWFWRKREDEAPHAGRKSSDLFCLHAILVCTLK